MIFLKRVVKSSNMELQFWGYEGGNILACIAGAGGFREFYQSVHLIVSDSQLSISEKLTTLVQDHADVAVTIGIVCLVLVAPPVRNLMLRIAATTVLNVFDVFVVCLAIAILLYALNTDTGWVSVASAAFVVASSLLRGCHQNPFMLKAGGCALLLGGTALAMFGYSQIQLAHDQASYIAGVLTLLTGFYVSGAGLLTYEGGIFQTQTFNDELQKKGQTSLGSQFLHPLNGHVPKAFTRYGDRGVQLLCRHVVYPSIFWISGEIKRNKPFLTSMWARMPWRFMTALAAFMSDTQAGFAFAIANVAWLLGDVAIGSEDWESPVDSKRQHPVVSPVRQNMIKINRKRSRFTKKGA